MDYFMGIDAGTQSARVAVYDIEGNCVAQDSKSWPTEYPKASWAEQDPLIWWETILDVMESVCSQLTDNVKQNIKTACVDATSSTVLAVDKDGTPLRKAIMWMDIRAAKEADEINSTGHKVLDFCGGEDSAEFFTPKVMWIKNNEPDIYSKTDVFCEQLDWINYKLSGVLVSSICTATCKANYVKSLGGYSDEFFKQIGFDDWKEKLLPDVLDTGATIGKLKPELIEKFGLNPDLLLVEGGVDAHVGMLGTNAIKEGRLCIIMGTSFCHLGITPNKPNVTGVWGPYEDAVVRGTWCVEAGQASAAGLVQWFIETYNIESDDVYATLEEAAKSIEPGAEGLIVCDNFQGNRTPYKDPYAKGVIYGLTMKHTWKHIYRALLEGVALGTYNIIDNFENQNYPINEIIGCGGVTKDELFTQIIADVCGKNIIINKDANGGVLGCAVIGAAVSMYDGDFQAACDAMVHPARIVEPDMDNHKIYSEILKKYKALYENTKAII